MSAKSIEDRAVEVAVASILIAREYKKLMCMALILANLSTACYFYYRIYTSIKLQALQERVESIEAKAANRFKFNGECPNGK